MAGFELIVVPHTHWDREWYRTHEDFRSRLLRLLDDLLDLLERDPSFRHFTLDGQTIVLDDYLAVRPHVRERIEALARAGRLLVGPWFVLPDEWLVSGEALVRNLRRGLRSAEAFGGAMRIGYVPDQFGHVGQLPQIFAGFGFEAAVLWRGVGADVGDVAFQWEAPDGTRLLTAYLRHGYGNAVDLPHDPSALASRVERERDGLRGRSAFRTALWMNGSDHREPDPALPATLAAAARQLDDVAVEIGTLASFTRRLREQAPPDLAVHRGELRSGLRAPLLEGCASSRMPQKRADFENDRLLTRYLEPLAAWLQALGGDADRDRLDFAWRLALENHPHDSICGCSIDAVHREMDVRFARVREIASNHLRLVTRDLAARLAPSAAAGGDRSSAEILVWNPNAAGPARAEGRVELDLPPRARRAPALHARAVDGVRLPVEAEIEDVGAVLAEYTVEARAAAAMLSGFPAEFFGQTVCAIRFRRRGGLRLVDVLMGDDPPLGFEFGAVRRAAVERLGAWGSETVHYRVRRLARVRCAFVDDFPGWGIRRYALAPGRAEIASAPAFTAGREAAGGAWIESERWRVEASPDGTVAWRDRHGGVEIRDALRLCSEGDRGDSYTFDPVPGDVVVDRPQRVRVIEARASEAGARLALEWRYRVPARLREDRTARSSRTVALSARVEISLRPLLDAIALDVFVENTAQDHRLRLCIRAPFPARRFEVESAFDVAERPVDPPRDAFGSETPAEVPTGATPQRSFATVSDGARAWTVANRGLAEVEAVPDPDRGTWIAVTLLRAVGWLSRGDLALRPGHAGPPLEVPEAQVPGPHRAELAVRAHPDADAQRTAAAHRFALPPRIFAAAAGGAVPADATARLRDGDRLIACDDPRVVVTAFEPAPDGSGCFARLYNASGEAFRANLFHSLPGNGGFERVDLLGRRPGRDAEVAPGEPLALRPWEITTLRIR